MKIQIISIALLFLIVLNTASYAKPGELDKSFGSDGNGIVITAITNNIDKANSIAIQKDGRIVVTGYYYNVAGDQDIVTVRYKSDGTLDNTFGGNGIVTTPIGSDDDSANSIAIQNDGKIVVVGESRNNRNNYVYAVVRYNSDGTYDNDFNGGGIVTTGIGSNDFAQSIAIQSDGKIVVAGSSKNTHDNDDVAIVRYNSNGTIDNTFGGGDGIVTTDIGNNDDFARSVAIQDDGKIVATGGSGGNYVVMRYENNGALDNTFGGGDGVVVTPITNSIGFAESIAIQNDGKIVVAGWSMVNGGHNVFTIIRYTKNGALDTSFDDDGIVTTTFESTANSVKIQNDGKIVVGGTSTFSGKSCFTVLRYNPNGHLDKTFGVNGKAVTQIGNTNSSANSIAIQRDGKIVEAGENYNSDSHWNFAITRYLGNSVPFAPIYYLLQ